jgi:hypothetical protein
METCVTCHWYSDGECHLEPPVWIDWEERWVFPEVAEGEKACNGWSHIGEQEG